MLTCDSLAKGIRIRPVILVFVMSLLAPIRASAAYSADGVHPLEPLSKEEIIIAVQVLKAEGKASDSSRFAGISLHEPPKQEVLRYKPGDAMRREAFVVVYERAVGKTFEAIVDITNRRALSWKEIPGVQPGIMQEDYFMLQDIVRSDPQWQEAMRKRGISDFENAQVDPWSAGNFGFPEDQGVRVLRAVTLYKGKSKNAYARPIEGVVAYVNMDKKKVYKLVDTGVVPVAKATGDYSVESIGKQREGPKPLRVSQPEGPSFTIEGHEVAWQNWRFRFGMNTREGLVLYAVGYEDKGKLRSILYRAACSEMLVAYGDPSPAWFFRNGFDEGEAGLGWSPNALESLTDVPENAVFFDATLPNTKGGAYKIPRAVALFERDGGILWKHYDYVTNESRRARELVLYYMATIGNYEYGFHWIFHQDGTLEMDVTMTGLMQTKGVNQSVAPSHNHSQDTYGHIVADGIAAVHHQHYFNFRLDLDVEHVNNNILEMNAQGLPVGPQNPYGNAILMKQTLFRRELEAQRQLNLASGRKWIVIDPSVKSPLGYNPGYALVPGENALPHATPDSSLRARAAFINNHFWVTRYEPSERYAAGDYVNQSKGGEGLPKWTAANRLIENQDVVVWYSMEIDHIPRPEEWPVMAVHHAGFKLIPNGFFDRNPALDVPKPAQVPVAKSQ